MMARPPRRSPKAKPRPKAHRGKTSAPEVTGQATISLSVTVNGVPMTLEVPAEERLLDTLRYRLGLTGTKEGCSEGECGSCTVYLDGLPANSCLVPTFQVRGAAVQTVESVGADELRPFLEHGSTQCGACTPGVMMTARWVRDHPELLERYSIRELMAGNLCRCTGYDGIADGLAAALGRAPTPT